MARIKSYKQAYMNPWGGNNQKKTIAGQWNFDNWKDTSNFDQSYFLSNIFPQIEFSLFFSI